MTMNLAELVGLAMDNPTLSGMALVVEKEHLHYDILFAMERERLLDGLVFQGGTALRLCHGALRFSEDLGFAGGSDFTRSRLAVLGDCLTEYLSGRYGLETVVRPPLETQATSGSTRPVVNKWRISVVTRPTLPDMPRQRVHLEVCNKPSYANAPMSLLRNYEFLPDGYENTIIRVETKDEILAEKLVAFPFTLRSHVRWRDLWDMHWLVRHGAVEDAALVQMKIRDYWFDDFTSLLEVAIDRLPSLVDSDGFIAQMGRFLTQPVVEDTIRRPAWREVAARGLQDMLHDLKRELATRQD